MALAQTNITGCGTISKSGLYSIPPHSTFQAKSGDCLVITAPNVIIQTQIAQISGNNTGAGIHIKAGATGFQLQPFATTINNFNIGIQDDANSASIGSDYGDPLWIGDQVDTAIFLNNVHGSVINGAGMHALSNGILIRGGGGNIVTGYVTSLGGNPGHNNGGPTECCWEVIASNGDAIRLDGATTGNHLYQYDVTQSGSDGAGVHIIGKSPDNFVAEGGVTNAGTGIRIESGSTSNFILNNDVTGNTLDVFDGNPNCDNDLWSDTNSNTRQPSCAN